MKLKLDKQKITTLSSDDLSNINGGGLRRSQRNFGGCNYSRREGRGIYKDDVNGKSVHIGCYKPLFKTSKSVLR